MHNDVAVAVSSRRVVRLSSTTSKVLREAPTFEGVFPDLATALAVLAPYWPSK